MNKLYNYLTSHPIIYKLSIAVYFILILVILVFYKSIFIDQNVSFYTYSTIVQGFLALVAFLGTVTIFKIQLIENEAQKISIGLEEGVKMYKGIEVHSYSWIGMMNVCQAILENKDSQWQIQQIRSGYDKLCKLRDEKSPIRSEMVDFSLFSFINIIMALIGIPLSKLFISQNLLFIGAIYLLINVTFSFVSIRSAFKLIRKCLGYSFFI